MFYLGVMGVIWSSYGPIVTWSWTNRDLVLEHSQPLDQLWFQSYVNQKFNLKLHPQDILRFHPKYKTLEDILHDFMYVRAVIALLCEVLA